MEVDTWPNVIICSAIPPLVWEGKKSESIRPSYVDIRPFYQVLPQQRIWGNKFCFPISSVVGVLVKMGVSLSKKVWSTHLFSYVKRMESLTNNYPGSGVYLPHSRNYTLKNIGGQTSAGGKIRQTTGSQSTQWDHDWVPAVALPQPALSFNFINSFWWISFSVRPQQTVTVLSLCPFKGEGLKCAKRSETSVLSMATLTGWRTEWSSVPAGS